MNTAKREKGGSVYISAAELDALANAASLLSALFEASDGNGTDLQESKDALYSVLQKAGKAQRRTAKKDLIKRALRVADETLAEG